MKKHLLMVGIILSTLSLLCSCENTTSPTINTNEQTTQERYSETATTPLHTEEMTTEPAEIEIDQEFLALGEELVDYLWMKMTASRDSWFDEYNGDTLQRIDIEESGQGIAQASDIIFYQASPEESLEQILVAMTTALYEPFFSPDDDREFTVTKYFLDAPNQEIWESEEMTAELIRLAWLAWNSSGNTKYTSEKECILYTIYESFVEKGWMPLGENMWILPMIEGYYQYEGKDIYRFEEYQEINDKAEQYGCLPFVREGKGKAYAYLLIKERNLYRLQRVTDMGIDLPAYWGDSEEAPAAFRELADAEINRQIEIIDSMRESWFSNYNGEELQLIRIGERKYPGNTDDIVFYRASEDESIADIVVKMTDALMQPFFTKEEPNTFILTKYFLDIEDQVIFDTEEMRERRLQDMWKFWKEKYPASESIDYIQRYASYSPYFRLVGENMWVLPVLKGYYQYEGNYMISYEEALRSWETAGGKYANMGLVPVDNIVYSAFILVKEENVYRLQLASEMGYSGWH